MNEKSKGQKIKFKTEEVFSELSSRCILMCHDSNLQSATTIIANEPIKGSWWPHRDGSVIFHTLGNILDSKDVIAPKLINGKVTLLYKELFPYFNSIVSSPKNWQIDNLKEDCKIFLRDVQKNGGCLRSDEYKWEGDRKLGDVIRDLEKKLLVYSLEIHTDSGAHAKIIHTWENYFKDQSLHQVELNEALLTLEIFANSLGEKVKLPWE